MVQNVKLTRDQEGSKEPKDDEIPPAFLLHSKTILQARCKAAVQYHLGIEKRWFQHIRKPSIQYKNPQIRYANFASEEKAMGAELFDYMHEQPAAINLSGLIGQHKWFANVAST